MTFDKMVQMMKKECDSDVRREHVLNQIQNFNLRSHMEDKIIREGYKILIDLVNILYKLTSQCPP